MKRPIIIAFAFLTLFLFGWSFNSEETEGGKPEKAARKFLMAFEKGDWDKVKKYSTSKTIKQLKYIIDSEEEPKLRKVLITGSMVRDESAQVYYKFKENPQDEYQLGLELVGKKWLVEATKTELKNRKSAPTAEELEEMEKVSSFDTSKWIKPEEVARGFLEAIEARDWIQAKALATDKTREQLDLLASQSGKASWRKVEILNSSSTYEKAVVYYRLEEEREEREINLVKKGSKWWVETTKQEISKEQLDLGKDSLAEGKDADREQVEAFDVSAWNSPEEVATAFLQAIENHNWIQAKALGTDQTRKELYTLQTLSISPKEREFSIIRAETDEDRAKVFYAFLGKDEEKVLKMIKVDQNWRIETTKVEMTGDNSLKGLGEELKNSIQDLDQMLNEKEEEEPVKKL